MERLTSNKDVTEMGTVELAHNSCYARDGAAWYRDYDKDIDARTLTRQLLKDFADGDDAFTCDEDFDEYMNVCLVDGFDSLEGLIAIFYRNLWAMADLHARLKHLEDLQEQGRLLELPCAVGDTVYEPTYDRMAEPQYFIAESSVLDVSAKGVWIAEDCFDVWENLGKTYFLDRKEAEEALKRMEDGDEAD